MQIIHKKQLQADNHPTAWLEHPPEKPPKFATYAKRSYLTSVQDVRATALSSPENAKPWQHLTEKRTRQGFLSTLIPVDKP